MTEMTAIKNRKLIGNLYFSISQYELEQLRDSNPSLGVYDKATLDVWKQELERDAKRLMESIKRFSVASSLCKQ